MYDQQQSPISFDFETDRVKPDARDASIVYCGVSNGKETIAFPWYGKVLGAVRDLLKSDLPKIGWNAKFESRWCLKEFGFIPKNWQWDGMVAAHVLDNRDSITSLKFQAFVQLGMHEYDAAMKLYFKPVDNNDNSPNRIREAPRDMALLYCGLDALLEWKIARIQRKEMGYE